METTLDKSNAKLHKALYVAARNHLPAWSKNDPEAVKAYRDHITHEAYGKIYDEMSVPELNAAIAALNSTEDIKNIMPSANQLNMLKFYMIAVALVYVNMKNWEYCDKETGVVLSGDDLRNVLREQFFNGNKRLPPPIVRRLYDEWINPKSNQFLLEGKYKKLIRNPNVLYYERLTEREVQYLKNRFAAIYNQAINKTANPVRANLN